MMLTVGSDGGTAVTWHRTPDGAARRRHPDYRPSVRVAASADRRESLREAFAADPKVAAVATERRRLELGGDREPVLRADLARVDEVRQFVTEVRHRHAADAPPGEIRLFDADFTPGFRFCLETGADPLPADPETLSVLRLSLPDRALAAGDLSSLSVAGDDATDPTRAVRDALDARDPDVLRVSHAALVPLLADRLAAADRGPLGRRPGCEKLAGASTYESYGRVGHSPARYAVPGRAVVDESNSFLLGEAGLAGVLDVAARSGKPLQEAARSSIGTLLTAIEVRAARERDVLAPLQKWTPERFKAVETLHAADRGGFTFDPDVGVHRDVFELDFASLYPNVIREYNVSPETLCCDCHDADDVPGLGYSVCDRPGFLPDVLADLLDDRAALKRRLREEDLGDAERARAEARSAAIKWVLVSCFGYQGYRNAKFGRIECHEAINAYARELLLDAKARLEAGGWRVVHGIVDSLWVTADAADPDPLSAVAADVSAEAGIALEREAAYDWVAFLPRRDGPGGALTKYVGVRRDGAQKLRGVVARQRSTPPLVADAQRAFVDAFDRGTDAVVGRLRRVLARLGDGDVPPERLAVTVRASKPLDAYDGRSRTVAALERASDLGMPRAPGQSVRYVVADDDARSRDRVRLACEDPARYDAAFYADRLVRAAAELLGARGVDEATLRRRLRGEERVTLDAFD